MTVSVAFAEKLLNAIREKNEQDVELCLIYHNICLRLLSVNEELLAAIEKEPYVELTQRYVFLLSESLKSKLPKDSCRSPILPEIVELRGFIPLKDWAEKELLALDEIKYRKVHKDKTAMHGICNGKAIGSKSLSDLAMPTIKSKNEEVNVSSSLEMSQKECISDNPDMMKSDSLSKCGREKQNGTRDLFLSISSSESTVCEDDADDGSMLSPDVVKEHEKERNGSARASQSNARLSWIAHSIKKICEHSKIFYAAFSRKRCRADGDEVSSESSSSKRQKSAESSFDGYDSFQEKLVLKDAEIAALRGKNAELTVLMDSLKRENDELKAKLKDVELALQKCFLLHKE